MSTTKALLLSARMGGGHNGVARVVSEELASYGIECETRDFLDASPRMGRILERGFKLEVERAPWAYQLEFWLWNGFTPIVTFTRRVLQAFFQRGVARWIEDIDPDIIIALHPFSAQLLGQMRHQRNPVVSNRPIATFLTDYSVHPLWVHPDVDLHLCVSETAAVQARTRAGASGEIVVTGPFVDPKFFSHVDRQAAREALSIPNDRFVALIVSGSWGVGDIAETFQLLASNDEFFPVALCGHNRDLQVQLANDTRGLAVGWTDDVRLYMAAADVVIQNAGGLTSLEAMAAERPVISYRPIAGHGRENVAAMESAGATVWCHDKNELVEQVRSLSNEPSEQVNKQLGQFQPAPHQPILELLHEARLTQTTRRGVWALRLTRTAAMLIALFVMANLVSGVIGYHGLNLTKTASKSNYVYLSVRLSSQQLANPKIDRLATSSGIGVVVTGQQAISDPNAVRYAYHQGVEVINGGTGTSSDFNFILPENDLSTGRADLAHALGVQVNAYLPQNTMNAFDLAWASLHHQTIIPARIISHRFNINPNPGAILELNLTSMSITHAAKVIEAEITHLGRKHLILAPFATLHATSAVRA
ncbi:MGDG synthase family glycosyltransferase [Ferrimicrobium acidiphilum]|uniref:Processive diacylglycerol beta-glucosyltransferase n=1 Tax=Ferrimicrobium acidiphilum DSM 19497 TaxID=1121877 RepID=A0A0D8FUT6_9ACTN|nr:glycosyltransferase [Ferrimicrobium acidiphilum]KJE76871.1 processive diacylglycerol beta-glucosyltransferase [Ferrimicrobium acidiphilum DSM 19497]MCL5053191.1 glycosyltransferase [Gammaproteobacteria bacterium]